MGFMKMLAGWMGFQAAPPEPISETAESLVAVLDEIVALLEDYEEHHWAGLMAESREAVARGGNGFRSVFSRYGGMGSFNDLIIAQHLSAKAMAEPNDRLDALRTHAYDLAVQVREEQQG